MKIELDMENDVKLSANILKSAIVDEIVAAEMQDIIESDLDELSLLEDIRYYTRLIDAAKIIRDHYSPRPGTTRETILFRCGICEDEYVVDPALMEPPRIPNCPYCEAESLQEILP